MRTGCTREQVSQLSKSFHTYVNEYRIAKANQLLTDKRQLNMDTVAVRCGFHSSQTGKGKVPTSFPDAFLVSQQGIADIQGLSLFGRSQHQTPWRHIPARRQR